MHRSGLRTIAFVVLALLGAPVAMHVVVHDLPELDGARAHSAVAETSHGDHEHPIVAASPAAPLCLMRATMAIHAAQSRPTACVRAANAERSVLSFGALRTDDDVGLQALLSTFLI